MPTDSVWRDAARATTVRSRALSLVVLADVTKCFENVDWRGLELAALSARYLIGLLRLSLAVYASPRRLLVGRASSGPLFPTRGIGPDSAFATGELLLLLSPHPQGWVSQHPGLGS